MSLKKIRESIHRARRYAVVLAAGLGLGMVAQHWLESRTAPSQLDPRGLSKAASPASPWGDVETTEFNLELSDELLPQVLPLLRESKWCFPRCTLQQITNLFRSCRFTDADMVRIMEGAEWDINLPGVEGSRGENHAMAGITPDSISLYPSPEFVLNLDPASRQKIYSTLAASELNPSQRYPFRFPIEEFDGWFSHSGLSTDKIALLKRMAYTNDNTVCLADLQPLQHVLTPNEMKRVLKAAYQAPTFTMRVRLPPQADVDALARYWGTGGRSRMIKPFIEGLAKSPGTPSVSVAFLLPAFARTHLYTFPDPAKDPMDLQQQGLWTALNFFNDQPDTRYLEKDFARKTLHSKFEAARGHQACYGDLVALTSPSGELLHISVYIADDVVFTRNGASTMQPWVLMKIPDMVTKFHSLGQAQTVFYHRKHA
jgi:hypothetical protein